MIVYLLIMCYKRKDVPIDCVKKGWEKHLGMLKNFFMY